MTAASLLRVEAVHKLVLFAPVSLVEHDGTFQADFILGFWTGIGFFTTLLVLRWLRGSGERAARSTVTSIIMGLSPEWTVGPVPSVRESFGGAHVTIAGSTWTLGLIYVSLLVGDVWSLDFERWLLLWPLE